MPYHYVRESLTAEETDRLANACAPTGNPRLSDTPPPRRPPA
jgi:hypothetical protein